MLGRTPRSRPLTRLVALPARRGVQVQMRLAPQKTKPRVPQQQILKEPVAVPGTSQDRVFKKERVAEYAPPDCSSPVARYNQLVKNNALRPDPHQAGIIAILQGLHDRLESYTQPDVVVTQKLSARLLQRFFSSSNTPSLPPLTPNIPKGLYLHGDVGTGKSMLMDLFYDTLPAKIDRKRRVHFHAFMIEIHKAVHALKAADNGIEDPILPVAANLASKSTVLCFDEFQVTDIVDAMILRRLLECLVNYGVILVMTSNRHPDDLYKLGIQRTSFLPAIELLKERFLVTDLNSETDYRKIPRALSNVCYHPINHANRREFDKLFKALASGSGSPIIHNRSVPIWGRSLVIPESANGIARFSFEDLCGKPLSAADYLEVTKTFGTVFLEDVPRLSLNTKDKARRFITFIDACYESKTKLFTLSEVPIFEIFSNESANGQITDHMRSVMDDLGLPADVVGSSSIFTGEEEIFAFARACSRLVQMSSKEWAETSARSATPTLVAQNEMSIGGNLHSTLRTSAHA
ncbi:AFG1-like ATPase-domain-containing protein [Cantharellus anzutake]|uniref:AFG1-like ATPase-domain-containing protein n=1 Tax=Cantharellus anzutake TaxID=1750568 RepID=UPI001906468C|nr:AFG1-like ATPase-domain-containing protein [Cantharellus anzutake]KAF8338739.1 AFG1-like ATPase-domain-containing protein [Cantharellus anzutake]